ncbi:MAG: hypothetical protein JWP25_373 [Bradyrhizobium sp.]|nr:hypothetical protein [Bradyrhizobium sp.]
MRLQMATPWNAVIAETMHIAVQYMDAFGLSTEMWEARTLSESPAGLFYERMVVIRPHWRVTPEQIVAFERHVHGWAGRVSPTGKFKII